MIQHPYYAVNVSLFYCWSILRNEKIANNSNYTCERSTCYKCYRTRVYSLTTLQGFFCMHPANERWRYIATPPLIGCVHTQNDPALWSNIFSKCFLSYLVFRLTSFQLCLYLCRIYVIAFWMTKTESNWIVSTQIQDFGKYFCSMYKNANTHLRVDTNLPIECLVAPIIISGNPILSC